MADQCWSPIIQRYVKQFFFSSAKMLELRFLWFNDLLKKHLLTGTQEKSFATRYQELKLVLSALDWTYSSTNIMF